MKLVRLSLLLLGACTGYIGNSPPPPPPPPAAMALEYVAQTTVTSSDTESEVPPIAERTSVYPTGRWVYADGYGWLWIQNEPGTTVIDGVPYVYLYTPEYGWTWYVSPWGGGPYAYGGWVRHPWQPPDWHAGWVAPSHVVVRIGDGYHGHGHHGYRPPPPRRELPRHEAPRHHEPPSHREPEHPRR